MLTYGFSLSTTNHIWARVSTTTIYFVNRIHKRSLWLIDNKTISNHIDFVSYRRNVRALLYRYYYDG